MSDPLYTLLYAHGAVVDIYPGSVGRTGCLRFVGTMAQVEAQITALKLTPLPAVPVPTPQQVFDAAVKAGYTVPTITPPLVLDLSESSQNAFARLLLLLNTSIAAGRMTPNDIFPITDIKGLPRVLSVANIQTMILGYGEYYAGLLIALHTPKT